MIYLTKLSYDADVSASVNKNANDFIIGDNIFIPTIKELIDYNDAIDTEITELKENDIVLSVSESQVIEPNVIG